MSNSPASRRIRFAAPLRAMAVEWEAVSAGIAARAAGNPEEIGAASYDYLMYSGYVALAYWWARSVAAADAGRHPPGFAGAKRETARFYFARLLPRASMHKAAIESGARPLMAMDAGDFGGV